ncbi:unnamed protein product [Toxocara canis]|uniref:DUF2769 domain-containing protein n=1 Tax=Toxocara canis TaxID=6265 RepID=A0A183VFT5_TOXCA|nr:unnamed protein product [Toxocara canis]
MEMTMTEGESICECDDSETLRKSSRYISSGVCDTYDCECDHFNRPMVHVGVSLIHCYRERFTQTGVWSSNYYVNTAIEEECIASLPTGGRKRAK